jgi:hypothetical protein
MSSSLNVAIVVEDYITDSSKASDIVEVLKAVALNDPQLCLEIVESIKKKLSTTEPEQLRAIELLDRIVDGFDMTMHQIVHEKNFLSFLEKIITNPSTPLKVIDRTKSVMVKWSRKFSEDSDIFPNFQYFFSRLVEQGLVDGAVMAGEDGEKAQVMDTYLINEAEGQDPEEFKAEVRETLKLFDDVYNAIVNVTRMSKGDSISRREALVSIAANLDRYGEQFGLWIEQLEPGEYMDEAIDLNEKVLEALDKYSLLRSGVVQGAPVDGDSSSSGSDSSDDSSDSDD